jgi:hypothetical protein
MPNRTEPTSELLRRAARQLDSMGWRQTPMATIDQPRYYGTLLGAIDAVTIDEYDLPAAWAIVELYLRPIMPEWAYRIEGRSWFEYLRTYNDYVAETQAEVVGVLRLIADKVMWTQNDRCLFEEIDYSPVYCAELVEFVEQVRPKRNAA